MVLFLEAETLRLLDLYSVRGPARRAAQPDEQRRVAPAERELPAQGAVDRGPSVRQAQEPAQRVRRVQVAERTARLPRGRRGPVGRLVARRQAPPPKCHAFKEKLPWVFESRMRLIVDDGDGQREVKGEAQPEQQDAEQDTEHDGNQELVVRQEEPEQRVQEEEAAPALPAESPLKPQHKRKRDNNVVRDSPRPHSDSGDWELNRTTTPSYDHSLSMSMEQSAVAAAGMARGFQDLIAMFQEEATRCRALEQQATRDDRTHPSLADQRSVLLSIAHSLEHSTRATADMAKGYRELVDTFVRETDVQRPRQLEPECEAVAGQKLPSRTAEL